MKDKMYPKTIIEKKPSTKILPKPIKLNPRKILK